MDESLEQEQPVSLPGRFQLLAKLVSPFLMFLLVFQCRLPQGLRGS